MINHIILTFFKNIPGLNIKSEGSSTGQYNKM